MRYKIVHLESGEYLKAVSLLDGSVITSFIFENKALANNFVPKVNSLFDTLNTEYSGNPGYLNNRLLAKGLCPTSKVQHILFFDSSLISNNSLVSLGKSNRPIRSKRRNLTIFDRLGNKGDVILSMDTVFKSRRTDVIGTPVVGTSTTGLNNLFLKRYDIKYQPFHPNEFYFIELP